MRWCWERQWGSHMLSVLVLQHPEQFKTKVPTAKGAYVMLAYVLA